MGNPKPETRNPKIGNRGTRGKTDFVLKAFRVFHVFRGLPLGNQAKTRNQKDGFSLPSIRISDFFRISDFRLRISFLRAFGLWLKRHDAQGRQGEFGGKGLVVDLDIGG